MNPYPIPSGSSSNRFKRRNESNPYEENFSYGEAHKMASNSLPNVASTRRFGQATHHGILARDIPYCGTFRHAPADPSPILKNDGLRNGFSDNSPVLKSGGLRDILVGNHREHGKRPIMTQVQISRENRYASRHFSEEDLDALPTFMYQEKSLLSNDIAEKSCSICLEFFVDNEELRLLSCEHKFHRRCIDRWLLGKYSGMDCHTNTCPVCKTVPQIGSSKTRSSVDIPSDSFLRVGACLLDKELTHTEINKEINAETKETSDLVSACSFLNLSAGSSLNRTEDDEKFLSPRSKTSSFLTSKTSSSLTSLTSSSCSPRSKTREDGLRIMMMLLDAAQEEDHDD